MRTEQRTITVSDTGLDHGGPEDDGTPLARAVDAAAALWWSDRKQTAGLQSVKPVQGPAASAPLYEWENPPDDLHVARHAGRRVVPLARVPGLISRGEISTGTTLAALLYALTRQESGN